MEVRGDYEKDGYALVEGLVAPEIARAFLAQLEADIQSHGKSFAGLATSNLLRREAVEIYGFAYRPMLLFLWGLTPIVAQLTGRDLLPTYDYFRIYREGDICRVHGDRPSCEHSLSLTLDYSDGVPWPIEVGKTPLERPGGEVAEDFGGEPYGSVEMKPGDALLYKGVQHRHGRITPNPNGWSAHLFLHWVERGGPYADQAFDGRGAELRPVNFRFT